MCAINIVIHALHFCGSISLCRSSEMHFVHCLYAPAPAGMAHTDGKYASGKARGQIAFLVRKALWSNFLASCHPLPVTGLKPLKRKAF